MATLRVVHNNIVPTSTLTASSTASTATVVANLAKEQKTAVWRSGTKSTNIVKAILKVVPASSTIVDFVGLLFTNTTSELQIRISGYTGTPPSLGGTEDEPTYTTTGADQVFITDWVYASPPQNLDSFYWGISPLGVSNFISGKTYARAWLSGDARKPCTSYIIELKDVISSKYIEVGNLVMGGPYWSPKYNTSYGLSAGTKDMSTNQRTENGDLISTVGPKYNVLNFDLKWLDKTDRAQLRQIFRINGKHSPIFVSLFPDNSADWELEQAYQIYGKLTELESIEHPVLSIYSSKIDIEEI